jgi:adenylate cyclase
MTEEDIKRRLAAILSADVEGYSRLMGNNEILTIRTLTAYKEAMTSLIKQHRGRVVDAPGDNLLAEFVSVRLESMCDGGGVCISGTAYEHVENKLDLKFKDLGEHTVKNIGKPVRVYRVLLTVESCESIMGETLELPDKPSIVVLPFDNMSGDAEQEYFVDGMTEEIITGLAKIPTLFVIARNSSFTYKGKPVKVQQVGKELGVQYLLEGSVRKAGDRIRMTAQLIDIASGHHLWAERFDRDL